MEFFKSWKKSFENREPGLARRHPASASSPASGDAGSVAESEVNFSWEALNCFQDTVQRCLISSEPQSQCKRKRPNYDNRKRAHLAQCKREGDVWLGTCSYMTVGHRTHVEVQLYDCHLSASKQMKLQGTSAMDPAAHGSRRCWARPVFARLVAASRR